MSPLCTLLYLVPASAWTRGPPHPAAGSGLLHSRLLARVSFPGLCWLLLTQQVEPQSLPSTQPCATGCGMQEKHPTACSLLAGGAPLGQEGQPSSGPCPVPRCSLGVGICSRAQPGLKGLCCPALCFLFHPGRFHLAFRYYK